MKLLIVDDEELTRVGVISSINWQSIGIDEVLQADDGMNGLEMARMHKPDIILCDVRMPRLDGIQMLEQLETILPDVVPVFMSGYSDKEYLKAAIKLKAVNYIEKPLDPLEIQDAVIEARDLCLERKRTRHNESIHSMENASRLALLLTQPYAHAKENIDQLLAELSLSISPSTSFTAIVLKTETEEELPINEAGAMYMSVREFLKTFHIDCIFAEKRVQYMVYFLFGPAPGPAARKSIEEFFCKLYSRYSRFCIAAGDTLTGISKAYQSYTSAVILLQNSFFFPAEPSCLHSMKHRLPGTSRSFLPIRSMSFLPSSQPRTRKGLLFFWISLWNTLDATRIFFPIRQRICITSFSVPWRKRRGS